MTHKAFLQLLHFTLLFRTVVCPPPSGQGQGQQGQPLGQPQGQSSSQGASQSHGHEQPNVEDDQDKIQGDLLSLEIMKDVMKEFGRVTSTPPLGPIEESAWQRSIRKGPQLYEWMTETSIPQLTEKMKKANKLEADETSQSKFVRIDDLKTNGWARNLTLVTYDISKIDLKVRYPVDGILKSLKISPEVPSAANKAAPNIPVTYVQDQTVYNGKAHEWATKGSITGFFNTKDGLIVLADAESPAGALAEDFIRDDEGLKDEHGLRANIVADNTPELHQISDVVFLEWLNQCRLTRRSPKNIYKYILYNVMTPGAVQAIDLILKAKDFPELGPQYNYKGRYEPPPWQNRLKLKPNTDDFNAVLGTPNAAIIEWMLLQHKAQLGVKRVKRIYISTDSKYHPCISYNGPTLTFEFEDVKGPVVGASGSGTSGGVGAGGSKQPAGGSKLSVRPQQGGGRGKGGQNDPGVGSNSSRGGQKGGSKGSARF